MPERKALWTPDGIVDLTGKRKADRVELRPGLIEFFRQFADFAAHFKLGLHCSICKADVIGKNADSDRVFTASCGCRDFVGQNREYRDPLAKQLH